jgi:hypothetical protein
MSEEMDVKEKTITKLDALKQIKLDCFKGVLEQMLRTYKEKDHDYGSSFDKTLDEFGLVAAVVRLEDKVNRLAALIKSDNQLVKDESIRDTLQDLANYAVLTLVYTDEATHSEGYLQDIQNKMQKSMDNQNIIKSDMRFIDSLEYDLYYKLRLDSKEIEYIHHQFDEYRSKWERHEIKLNDIKEEYNNIVESKKSKITKPRSIADEMIDEMAKLTKENWLEARLALENKKHKKPEQTKLDLK